VDFDRHFLPGDTRHAALLTHGNWCRGLDLFDFLQVCLTLGVTAGFVGTTSLPVFFQGGYPVRYDPAGDPAAISALRTMPEVAVCRPSSVINEESATLPTLLEWSASLDRCDKAQPLQAFIIDVTRQLEDLAPVDRAKFLIISELE
jgi:hypothetical protein